MATHVGSFSARPYTLRLIVTTNSQSGNSSKMDWTLKARSTSGYGSFVYDAQTFNVKINGTTYQASSPMVFGPSGDYAGKEITIGSGTTGWIAHGSDGRKSISVRAWGTATTFGSADTGTNTYTFARRPVEASAPRSLTIGSTTPTSVALSWTAPSDDGGSSITTYLIQWADNPSFTDAETTTSSSRSKTITDLVAGPTYYFRVYAANGAGNGPWSNVANAAPALPAPSITSWVQNDSGALVASWAAPEVVSGLTGYRVTIARDEDFSLGVVNYDIADTLTHSIAGLAGGRRYWVKVAARTSGGVNAYSGSLNALLVLDAGDLDGWTRTGTKPAEISYYTAEGIRRGTVNSDQALILESLSTGSVTLAGNTYGIEREMTGLIPGRAYRFEATITGTFPATPTSEQGAVYRLGIGVGGTLGDTATLLSGDDEVEIPPLEFVATGTTQIVRVLLAEVLTISGARDQVEQVAISHIQLLELDTDYPQRLRATVYESNLANHFDLACNSVGATWYVDRLGVTRFRLPGASLPVSAVFSDEVDPSAVSYVDISAGYDTRSTVNRLEATNYGVDLDGETEANDDLIVEDTVSQEIYGVYRDSLSVNLYDEAPYNGSFQDRLDSLVDAVSVPGPTVSQIRWNGQEDINLARTLEVGQRVTVRYRGDDYDSQIVALTHEISPKRWIITIDLQAV